MAETAAKVPVPRTVTALYVVLTDRVVDSVGDSVIDAGPVPPVPPASLLLARGTSPEVADRATALPHAVAVVKEAPVDEVLENERAARSAALALASRHDGLVLDARVPRIVDTGTPSHLRSTDWFVFEHADDEVLTHGLVRFGVPELRCREVPPDRVAMYDAALVGAGQRVAEEWPGNDPVGPATITMRDIARGYGDASAGGDDPTLTREVDVTISYDPAAELLLVTLHDDPAEALFGA